MVEMTVQLGIANWSNQTTNFMFIIFPFWEVYIRPKQAMNTKSIIVKSLMINFIYTGLPLLDYKEYICYIFFPEFSILSALTGVLEFTSFNLKETMKDYNLNRKNLKHT